MVMEEEQSHMELASESVPVPQVIISNDLMNNEIATPKKKPRLRKKALHAAIRKQMEFYFSDANLSKDRFLGHLIKQDPYVELQIFLRFNKIRSLTTDMNQIIKALQKSEMLSVSEDGSRVCRITPISEKENIEECTIYVQRLPLNADHEWLSNVFSQYGTVSYVSIPRYKSNKKIKGFAFVEFEDPSSAVKCIQAFRDKGCVLPSQTSPESLLSITTFHEEEMMEKQRNKQANEGTVSMGFKGKCEEVKDVKFEVRTKERNEYMEAEQFAELKTGQEQKHEESEEVSDSNTQGNTDVDSGLKDEKKQKKLKGENIEDELDQSSAKLIETEFSVKKQKHKDSEAERTDDNEVEKKGKKRRASEVLKEEKSESSNESGNRQNEDSADSEKEKKSKKRRQRSLSITKNKEISESVEEKKDMETENDKNVENEEPDEVFQDDEVLGEEDRKKKRKRKRHNRAEKVDTADIGMQIMAKKDWKTLRNKYLELQRSKMKSLKTHLKRATWNQRNNYEKFRESDKSKIVKDERKENADDQKAEKSTQRFVFTPGVIVRVEMDEPCTDPKTFKMELKRNSNIKYIDITEGASEAFLRCDTNEAAKALVLQSNEERSMSILEDKEETEYWNKMSKDREEKLGKKIRVKQRGRDKLLKKAEKELGKHIKFDEV